MFFILTRAFVISAAVVGAAPLVSAAPTPGALARSSEVSSGSAKIWEKASNFISSLSSFVPRSSTEGDHSSSADSVISKILGPRGVSVVFAKDTETVELVSRNCRAIMMCKRDPQPTPEPIPVPMPVAEPGPERLAVALVKRDPTPAPEPVPAPARDPEPELEPEPGHEEVDPRNCNAIAMCKRSPAQAAEQ